MLSKDPEEKLRRGYVEKDSFVRLDGSEKLVGQDWKRRKEELLKRSNGWCERWTVLHKLHAPHCYREAEEPHHIVARWLKRDDRIENLAYLSHACHRAEDQRKIGGRK